MQNNAFELGGKHFSEDVFVWTVLVTGGIFMISTSLQILKIDLPCQHHSGFPAGLSKLNCNHTSAL